MSKSLTLYQMSEDFTRYMEAETDEEIASALADITAGQIEVKVQSYCEFIASLDGFAEQCKTESDRIAKVAKTAANKAARIREHMKECMLIADINKLSAGTFTVSLAKNPGKLIIDDATVIPAQYLTYIPASTVPNNAEIKEALKAGEEVKGAHIETGTSLRIK